VTDHHGHETPPSPYSHSHSSHNHSSSASVTPSHSPPRSANSSPQTAHKKLAKKPQNENKDEEHHHEEKDHNNSGVVARKAHDVLFGGAKSKTEKELDLLGTTPQEIDRFKDTQKAYRTMGGFQAEPKPVVEHPNIIDKKDEDEDKDKKETTHLKASSKAQDLLFGGNKSKKQKKLEKLGMTQSEFDAFQKNPRAYQKFVLTGGGIENKVEMEENIGEIHVCVWYNKLIDRLNVEILEAHHLPAMDSNGFSDPFVKIYLNPDPKKLTRHVTQVIKKTLNPVWNETFGFDLPLEEVRKKKIRLAVWDYDFGPTNDYIGEVSIKLNEVCTNQKEKKIEIHKLINKKRKGRAATIDEPSSSLSISSSSSHSSSTHSHRPAPVEEGKEDEDNGGKEQSTHHHAEPSSSPSHEPQHTQQQQQQQQQHQPAHPASEPQK